MSAHLLIKDGIVFCGTSFKDIQDISADRFPGQHQQRPEEAADEKQYDRLFRS